jgi:hypothetical protein
MILKSNFMKKIPNRYKYLKRRFYLLLTVAVLLMMIRLAFDDGKRPVQLFGKEQANHLV